MAEQAYAYVTLIPVAKGFKNSIEKELGGVAGVGASVGADAGGRFAGGFGGALKGLAVAAGSALAAAGIGRFFSESITQASDLGESVNAVNKAYGDFAGDVLKLGGDVANRLGLATVDFNAAAVRFSSFAGKIAGQGGDVAGVVDSLTTRAADFASVFNIEVSEALQVFQSGLSGEAEPLKRFGINLLDSEVKAYAYANGIASVGSELTETEKVQARYGLLLQETAKTAGDFADTSDGLANSQRILAANLKNLQAEVGAGLTPVMATFTSALVPLAQIIFPAIATFLNTYIAPGLQRAADAFKAFAESATLGGEATGTIFERLKGFLDDFLSGGGFQQFFDRLSAMRTQFFEAIQRALPGIMDGFIAFYPVFLQTAVQFFSLLIQALTSIIPPLVQTLLKALPVLIDAMLSLLPVFIDGAVQLFNALIDAIDIILPPLIDAVVEAIPVIVTALLSALPILIEGAVKLFTALLQGLEKFLPDLIKAVLKIVPTIVTVLLQNIPLLIGAAIDLLAGLARGLIENAPRILGAAIGAVGETLVEGIKNFLGIRSPSRVFYEVGENVSLGLANGIQDTIPLVEAAGSNLANATTGIANKIEKGFRVVSNIPGMVSTAMKEVIKITEADVRRMAETVDGLFAKFDKKGNLVQSYTGYGVPNLVPTVDGEMFDVSRATSDLNAIYNYMGAKTIEQMEAIQDAMFGGSFQQAIDTLTGSVTLVNPKTGMSTTIGGTPEGIARAVADAQAKGFEPLEPLGKSVDELKDVLESLAKQIDEKGLAPAGIAMAAGGYVDQPTPALVGEAGPEVVMPLDRFEKIMGLTEQSGKTLNYYAAPNQSIDSEMELFQAMRRAKVVANW
jgi:phage-related protein